MCAETSNRGRHPLYARRVALVATGLEQVVVHLAQADQGEADRLLRQRQREGLRCAELALRQPDVQELRSVEH